MQWCSFAQDIEWLYKEKKQTIITVITDFLKSIWKMLIIFDIVVLIGNTRFVLDAVDNASGFIRERCRWVHNKS